MINSKFSEKVGRRIDTRPQNDPAVAAGMYGLERGMGGEIEGGYTASGVPVGTKVDKSAPSYEDMKTPGLDRWRRMNPASATASAGVSSLIASFKKANEANAVLTAEPQNAAPSTLPMATSQASINPTEKTPRINRLTGKPFGYNPYDAPSGKANAEPMATSQASINPTEKTPRISAPVALSPSPAKPAAFKERMQQANERLKQRRVVAPKFTDDVPVLRETGFGKTMDWPSKPLM